MRAIVRFSRKGIHIVKKEQNKKQTGPKWRQKIGKLLALLKVAPIGHLVATIKPKRDLK